MGKSKGRQRSKAEARDISGALGHTRRNSHPNSVICNCYGQVGIEHSLPGCAGKQLRGLNLFLFKPAYSVYATKRECHFLRTLQNMQLL